MNTEIENTENCDTGEQDASVTPAAAEGQQTNEKTVQQLIDEAEQRGYERAMKQMERSTPSVPTLLVGLDRKSFWD